MNTTDSNSLTPFITPFVPVMDRKRFAQLVGVSDRVVDGWISRGYVSVVKLSNGDQQCRYSLINILALSDQIKRGAI